MTLTSLLIFLTGICTLTVALADEVTSKGSKAFQVRVEFASPPPSSSSPPSLTHSYLSAPQYLEYLKALGASSYAFFLTSCDLTSEGLISQGAAVQHVLCDAPAVTQSGECSNVCKVLVDFLSADCILQVAQAEKQIAADFKSAGSSPSEELETLTTLASAYLYNKYESADVVLADEKRVEEVLEGLADSSQADGVTAACSL